MKTKTLKTRIEKPTKVRHWGQLETITPRVVSAIIGDGKKLIGIAPTMYRPNYFVARIDSSHTLGWSDENGPDKWLDDLCDIISDEFYEWPWADDYWPEETDDEESEHRRVNWSDGSCWWEEEWPKAAATPLEAR